MSNRIFALTIALATCFCSLNETLYAQRGNILEGLGKSLLNEALNGSKRQPPPTSPPTVPRIQQQAPNESGRTPGSNPYGGRWGNIIQPQPQPQPQPRPQVTPRQGTPRRAYPPNSSQRFDTYHYGPPRSSGTPLNRPTPGGSYFPPDQQQPPIRNQTTNYYPSQTQHAGPIKIKFPKTQQGLCEFLIVSGSKEYPRRMNPGEMQQLEGTTVWKVRLNQNGVSKTFRLSPGSEYVFTRNSAGVLELLMKVKPLAVENEPSQN